jgi:soluble lytic murein transglycosylase
VSFLKRIAWLVVLLAAAPAYGAGPVEDFLAARDAYNANDAARLEVHAKRLQGHLLQPYADYWQLSFKLEDAAPDEVRAFLASNRDTPLSDRLRAEWLKILGRRGEWGLFNSALPQLAATDLEITCYDLRNQLQENPGEALPEARALWFLSRDLPENCTPLMAALYASGGLSTDDLWARIRIVLDSGQVSRARVIAEWLPAGQAPEAGSLEGASSNPVGYLERKTLNLKTRAGREAVMFAANRLARSSPSQAVLHWARLEERFSEDERQYVWGTIAYFGAMRHERDALGWYRKAGNLSDIQLAWKARAALRAQDWVQVLAAIDAMTGMESSLTAWRYWKARALKALGRDAEAEPLLRQLATVFGFYGQLAQEELGGLVPVPAASYKPNAEDVRAMAQHAGLRRALELYRMNQRTEATWEWLWAIRGFDDRQLLAAAEVARRHQIYDRAIGTADRTVLLHDFALRYPAPYRDVLKPQAAQFSLDEAWVYGVIRQESRFIADAKSSAGASGLMQLMPGTARWVAQKLRLKNWRWSQVTEVPTNLSLGTYYLRHVLDTQGGQLSASAAYNAGPTRARGWRPESAMEGAIFAETIPLTETRIYVKNVMANTTYYSHTLHQQLQSLKQRLGVVGPRLQEIDIAPGDMP